MKRRIISCVLLNLVLGLLLGCREKGSDEPVPAVEVEVAGERDPLEAAVLRVLQGLRGLAVESADTEDAVEALVALGDPAVPALGKTVNDPDPTVRLAVAVALGRIGTKEAIEPLLAALNDATFEVRLAAVEALGTLGDARAVQPLLTLFDRDEDPQVRYECLTSLGRIGSPQAIERLVAETRNQDPNARFWAMEALCRMEAPQAPELVIGFLEDADVNVRHLTMARCTNVMHTPAAHESLLAIALDDPNWDSSVRARKALRELMTDPATSQTLRDRIQTAARPRITGDASPEAMRAAFLLAELEDSTAFDTLLLGLQDPEVLVRHHAAYLLSRVPDDRAVAPLIKAMEEDTPMVKLTAFLALQRFGAAGNAEATKAVTAFYARRGSRPPPAMK